MKITNEQIIQIKLEQVHNEAYVKGRADEAKELVHTRQAETIKQYTRIADALEKISERFSK